MNCKHLDSGCEMQRTLEKFDETTIGYVSFTVEKGLCKTDKHTTCGIYKLKNSLAEKK